MPAGSTTPPVVQIAPRSVSRARNIAHGANDLYWFILPPVLPLILQEFGLRYAAAGGMIAVFLTVIAAASMLTGRLSDRVHRGTLIALGFLLASAAVGAAALMPLLPLVVACLVIAAVGVSTYHPAAYASIHDAGHGNGRTYGAFEASGSLAIILMLAVQGVLAGRAGWRELILVGAAPGAVVGLLFLLAPGGFTWEQRRATAAPRAPRTGGARRPGDAPSAATGGILLPALFVVGVMLRVLGLNGLTNFVPTYLVRAVGMGQGISSFAVGFTFLGGICGAMVMGRVADRRGPFPVFLLCSGLLVPLLPLLGLRMAPALYPAALVLVGFCNSACLPSQNMILGELSGSRSKGSVFGVLMGATALTSAVSPLAFGLIADAAGLRAAVRACVIPVAAGWLVVLAVRRRLSRAYSAESSSSAASA
ncbi:MAG TPA: MFS transporter [Spirochaetia bacterium]|nr:MFS transporter [Spirochaetia bacterium]